MFLSPVGGGRPPLPLSPPIPPLAGGPLVPCGCLPEDIPAPLQQLDHGCHPSMRQRCHYTWYESLTVQDVDTFWSGYGPGLRLGQHFMACPIFSCCLSLQVGSEQVGQVCVCLHGTGGEAEAPDVRGLPGVTGHPGWRLVTRGLLASTSTQACAGGPGHSASVGAVRPPPPRHPDCSCLEVGLVEAWLAWEPGPVLAVMILSWDFGQVSSCFWASVSSFVKCG